MRTLMRMVHIDLNQKAFSESKTSKNDEATANSDRTTYYDSEGARAGPQQDDDRLSLFPRKLQFFVNIDDYASVARDPLLSCSAGSPAGRSCEGYRSIARGPDALWGVPKHQWGSRSISEGPEPDVGKEL